MAMSRFDGCRSLTTSPSMLMSPSVIVSSPAMVLSSVDLPQPDGPTRTRKPPWSRVMSMPFRTSRPPKRLRRPAISRKAMAVTLSPRRPSGRARSSARRPHRRAASAARRSSPPPCGRCIPSRPVEVLTRLFSATVIGASSPAANEAPNRKSFQMLVNWKITVTTMIGPDDGSRMRRKIWKKPAPSICAARISSSGNAS